jgi:hypothetical protein
MENYFWLSFINNFLFQKCKDCSSYNACYYPTPYQPALEAQSSSSSSNSSYQMLENTGLAANNWNATVNVSQKRSLEANLDMTNGVTKKRKAKKRHGKF